jgi:hypothetical protein
MPVGVHKSGYPPRRLSVRKQTRASSAAEPSHLGLGTLAKYYK